MIVTTHRIRSIVVLLLFFSGINYAFAQSSSFASPNKKTMSLMECIQLGINRNLDVKMSQIQNQSAQLDYRQSLFNLGPDLNGSVGQFYQSGRSIDRFTNQFVQTTVGNTSLQAQVGWTVFSGGQLRNTIKQNRLNVQSTELDITQTRQNIALNISLQYLLCLQSQEQVKASASQIEYFSKELKRVQLINQEGAGNKGLVLNAQAQLSNAKSNLVQAENLYKSRVLTLKNMLMMEPTESLDVVPFEVAIAENNEILYGLNQLMDSALARRADYQSSLLKVRSSRLGLKVAKGSLLPSLFIGGNLSSVYSDNAKTITNVTLAGTTPIGVVQGSGAIVEAPRFDYQTQTIGFGNQIRDNFGQSFGATLSVPIYNKMATNTQISKSELAITQAELNALRIKQSVYNDVSTAYFGYENAKAQYLGQKENYEAQKQNLEFVQIRYQAGQSTPFELQLALNSEVSAYQNFLAAKYEFILRQLILDVMMTNNIELSLGTLMGSK